MEQREIINQKHKDNKEIMKAVKTLLKEIGEDWN